MLGYSTAPTDCMFSVNRHPRARILSALWSLFFLMAWVLVLAGPGVRVTRAQQIRQPSAKGGVAEVSSTGPQRRQGELTIADGEVDIHYGSQRLRV